MEASSQIRKTHKLHVAFSLRRVQMILRGPQEAGWTSVLMREAHDRRSAEPTQVGVELSA